jgi:hypothetical protein
MNRVKSSFTVELSDREGLGEGTSAYHQNQRGMFLNPHPHRHLALVHQPMRARCLCISTVNRSLRSFSLLATLDAHTCWTWHWYWWCWGLLTAASINMCYIRFNSPIMCRPSHCHPSISTTLGTEYTEPTNYERHFRKPTELLIVLWLIKWGC